MNKAEFIEWLKDAPAVDYESLCYDFMATNIDWYKDKADDLPDELKDVEFEQVDSYGGEDCGSIYYSVYKFKLPNGEEFALKFVGFYASHYGAEFENVFEVKPQEKVVTEWV